MLQIFGLLMVVATIIAMFKRVESRLVLIVSGFIMAAASMNVMAAFDGFSKGMLRGNMILCICSVMAFAYVMRYTGCDRHLCYAVAHPLRHVRFLLVPGAVLITFLVQIALPSASGAAAAVGAVVIPLLIRLGVHPAMAGAAVLAGSYGDLLSPGLAHNVYVAKIASEALNHEVTVIDVIRSHTLTAFIAVGFSAGVLWLLSVLRREGSGYVADDCAVGEEEHFRINFLYAFIPILPIALLILGVVFPKELPWIAHLKVEHTMLLGAMAAIICTRKNPMEASREFFMGLGHGYGEIIGIIIAAAVFVAGMNATGIVETATNWMKGQQTASTLSAAIGPWALAVVCGSGNAATQAFNEAVTVHALDLGVNMVDMGSLATFAGSLGRCMSPVAGVCFVCAGLARVDPASLVKRTLLPSICALVSVYLSLFVF